VRGYGKGGGEGVGGAAAGGAKRACKKVSVVPLPLALVCARFVRTYFLRVCCSPEKEDQEEMMSADNFQKRGVANFCKEFAHRSICLSLTTRPEPSKSLTASIWETYL
jgi:hypothetical protein